MPSRTRLASATRVAGRFSRNREQSLGWLDACWPRTRGGFVQKNEWRRGKVVASA